MPEVLEAIIARIPPPSGDPLAPLKSLIFDSWFDNYQGVIVLTRVVDGALRPGMKIKVMSNERMFEVMEVGQFTPKRTKGRAADRRSRVPLREYERSRGRQNRRYPHRRGVAHEHAIPRVQGSEAAGVLRALSHRHGPV